MEKKCTVADGNVDEAMVKIYCLTCGKFIGRAAPGNLSGSHCEKCRNEYWFDLREGGSKLKSTTFEVSLKL